MKRLLSPWLVGVALLSLAAHAAPNEPRTTLVYDLVDTWRNGPEPIDLATAADSTTLLSDFQAKAALKGLGAITAHIEIGPAPRNTEWLTGENLVTLKTQTGELISSHGLYSVTGGRLEIGMVRTVAKFRGLGASEILLAALLEHYPQVTEIETTLAGTNIEEFNKVKAANPGISDADAVKQTPAFKARAKVGWANIVDLRVTGTSYATLIVKRSGPTAPMGLSLTGSLAPPSSPSTNLPGADSYEKSEFAAAAEFSKPQTDAIKGGQLGCKACVAETGKWLTENPPAPASGPRVVPPAGTENEKQRFAVDRLADGLVAQFRSALKGIMSNPLTSPTGKAFAAGMVFHLAAKAKAFADGFPANADAATRSNYFNAGLKNLMFGIGAFAKGAVLYSLGAAAIVSVGNAVGAGLVAAGYATAGLAIAGIASTAVAVVTVVLAGIAFFVGMDELISAFPSLKSGFNQFLQSLRDGSGGLFNHSNANVCQGACTPQPGGAKSPPGAAAASNAALNAALAEVNANLLGGAPGAGTSSVTASAASTMPLPGYTNPNTAPAAATPVYKLTGGMTWASVCSLDPDCTYGVENIINLDGSFSSVGVYKVPSLSSLVSPQNLVLIGITGSATAQDKLKSMIDRFNAEQRTVGGGSQGTPTSSGGLQPKGATLTATPITRPNPVFGQVVP